MKYLNYLRHCLELSNLEQDVERLTESLIDALTTDVSVFTFKEKKLEKSKKIVRQRCKEKHIPRLTDTSEVKFRLAKRDKGK